MRVVSRLYSSCRTRLNTVGGVNFMCESSVNSENSVWRRVDCISNQVNKPSEHSYGFRSPFGSPETLLKQKYDILSLKAFSGKFTRGYSTQELEHVQYERSGPMARYQRLIDEQKLNSGDIYQEEALAALQALYDVLIGAAADGQLSKPTQETSHSLWSRWLPSQKRRVSPIRGLYLWGGVGTGKTMLMDMFYDELPSWLSKRRIHFHDFMISVHTGLQKQRGVQDPLAAVAEQLSSESLVLCLDEFMVTDVADAMILNRLFGFLFSRGVVLISTSNRHPDSLYEKGLQRDLFIPFIDLLKNRCVVHRIGSDTDYRRLTKVQQGLYFTGPEASDLLWEKFHLVTEGVHGSCTSVEVAMGRMLDVPYAAAGVAYFQFHQLCEMPLGAADFIGLVQKFHTVAVDGIPKFGASNLASAYRFVTLVDVMYEHKARLLCSAEGTPAELFERVVTLEDAPKRTSSRLNSVEDVDVAVDQVLGFAKDRTMSRLTEMQSKEYQSISH